MTLWTALLSAFGVSLVVCTAFVLLAPRLGFIDAPGAESHKQQRRAVPYGGGVAIAIAFAAAVSAVTILGLVQGDAWIVSFGHHRDSFVPIVVGAAALFIVGLLDDLRPWRARYKLLAQLVIITGTISWAGLRVEALGAWPWLSVLVGIFWCLLLTNAYNLMDHADGLSATMAMIAGGVFVALSLDPAVGDSHLAALWVILLGALTGFWLWNCPPARLYMGDAGSLPLGYLMGISGLVLRYREAAPADEFFHGHGRLTLAVMLIAAIPLYDTAVVILKRWRRRLPLMRGDRGHISHRLSRLGLRPWASLAVVAALQFALGAGALLMPQLDLLSVIIVVTQAVCICLIALLLEATRDHQV